MDGDAAAHDPRGQDVVGQQLAGEKDAQDHGDADPFGPELQEGYADGRSQPEDRSHVGDEGQGTAGESDGEAVVESGERQRDAVERPQRGADDDRAVEEALEHHVDVAHDAAHGVGVVPRQPVVHGGDDAGPLLQHVEGGEGSDGEEGGDVHHRGAAAHQTLEQPQPQRRHPLQVPGHGLVQPLGLVGADGIQGPGEKRADGLDEAGDQRREPLDQVRGLLRHRRNEQQQQQHAGAEEAGADQHRGRHARAAAPFQPRGGRVQGVGNGDAQREGKEDGAQQPHQQQRRRQHQEPEPCL